MNMKAVNIRLITFAVAVGVGVVVHTGVILLSKTNTSVHIPTAMITESTLSVQTAKQCYFWTTTVITNQTDLYIVQTVNLQPGLSIMWTTMRIGSWPWYSKAHRSINYYKIPTHIQTIISAHTRHNLAAAYNWCIMMFIHISLCLNFTLSMFSMQDKQTRFEPNHCRSKTILVH